jgi:biotin transporter BioY
MISVAVSNTAAGKTGSTSMQLTVINVKAPHVHAADAVEAVQYKHNVENRIQLVGHVQSFGSASIQADWSSSSCDLSDTLIAATPSSRAVGPHGSASFPLVIAPHSLTAGLSYVFQLSARYVTLTASASVTVNIVMNAPPRGGTITVTPTTGSALVTPFLLLAIKWIDDLSDYPLSYELAYYQLIPTELNYVKNLDLASYATVFLGQGLSSNDYRLHCVANVYDIYDGKGSDRTPITVYGPPPSRSLDHTISEERARSLSSSLGPSTLEASISLMNGALSKFNPALLFATVSNVLSTINSVDCSSAPIDCGSGRNREVCRRTGHTCGACLTGYVGVPGDANSACELMGNVRKDGESCSGDRDCMSGSCESGRCVDPPKSCPSNCNGQGACVFYDMFDQVVSNCTMTKPFCRAKCDCDAGYAGVSCSITASDYHIGQGYRSTLCEKVLQAIRFQDVHSSSIISRALTVGNILTDIDQVTEAGLRDCVSVLLSTVEAAPELSCSSATLPLLMNAYSSVISKGTNLSLSVLSRIEDSMERLATGCQDTMAIGEQPVTMKTGMILFLTTKADRAGLQGKQFQLPQSVFDSFGGGSTSSVQIDGSALGPSDYVGLSASQYLNNPGNKASAEEQSAPMQLAAQSNANFSFQISLRNIESVQYSAYNVSSTSGSVRCDRYETSAYEVSVDCSHGRSATVTCPAQSIGSTSFTCPGRSLLPYCTALMDGSYAEVSGCEVVHFDDDSTTCKCALSALTRRLLTSSSKSFSTASREADIGTFKSTYIPSLPSVIDSDSRSKNAVIVILLCCVVVCYVLGFIILSIRSATASGIHEFKHGHIGRPFRSIHLFYEDIFPSALRVGSWHYVWGSRLLQEHLLVNVVSSMVGVGSKESSAVGSLTKWTLVMGKWLVYLFVNCVVTKLMYADDGFCGDQSTESSCEGASTTGKYFRACEWHSDGEYCAFHDPVNTFGTIMLLTLLVTLFSSPIYQLMEYCLHRVADFCYSHLLSSRVASELSESPPLEPKNDEFRIVQTYRSTLLRAARLEKIRRTVDDVRSQDEERSIVHSIEDGESRDALISSRSADKLKKLIHLKQQKSLMKSSTYILDEIELSRSKVGPLMEVASSLETAQQQEEFLMSYFIVDSFHGCKRRIAAKHFLERFARKTRSDQTAAIEYLSIGVFVGMVAVMIYFIVYFSTVIGSRSTDLWLIIALVSFFEDLIILQPLIVWINWAMIDVPVARDAREMVDYLSKRSRFIMMRTAGQMRDAEALVQHFNSACRAARMFPALPVSRLLFSLNDSDVPLHKPFNYLYALTQMTAYLPRDIQAAVLNMFVAFLMNLLAVLFYDFGLVSAPAAFAVAAGLFVVLVLSAYLSYRSVYPGRLVTESDRVVDLLPFQPQADPRQYSQLNSFRPLLSLTAAAAANQSSYQGGGLIFDQQQVDQTGDSSSRCPAVIYEKEEDRQVQQLMNDVIKPRPSSAGLDNGIASSLAASVGGDEYDSAKSAFELQMQEIYSKVSSTVDIQQPPSPVPVLATAAESDPTYYSGLSIVEVRAMLDSSAGAALQKPLSVKKEASRVVSITQQEQDD